MTIFYALLNEHLRKARMTGEALAEKLGLKPTIMSYIRNDQDPMHPDHLETCADVLDIHGKERELFIFEGHCRHCHPNVARAHRRLKEQAEKLEAETIQLRDENRQALSEASVSRADLTRARLDLASAIAEKAAIASKLDQAIARIMKGGGGAA